jgi:hypothetical protein
MSGAAAKTLPALMPSRRAMPVRLPADFLIVA